MKTIFLTGRLTADPELKKVGDNDSRLVKFTLANNENSSDNAEFYDIHCWDSIAEFAAKNLKKGNRIIIQGTFSNSAYTDKEGKKRVHFDINAYKLEFAD